MKSRVWVVGLVVAAAWSMIGLAAEPAATKPTPLPSLTVDKSSPLLLDEPASDKQAAAKAKASSARKLICHDCHANFLEDPFCIVHEKNKITCVNCHGVSEAHSGDENNVTPPQVMYARDAIAAKCQQCHKTHNAPAAAVVARWQQKGLQKLDASELVCTDCHGEHRMKVRTVLWDKKTGKLLGAPKAAIEKLR